jgi:DMSO reductase anchor subunit
MANLNSPFVRAVAATVVLFIAFSLVALVIPPDPLSIGLRVLLVLACIIGVYRWGPTALRVYRNGASEPHEQGILAVVVLLLGLAANQVYSAVYVALDRPEWVSQYHFSGFLVFLILIGVVLFTVSTRLEGEKHSPLVGIGLAVMTAISVAVAGLWPKLVSIVGPIIAKMF